MAALLTNRFSERIKMIRPLLMVILISLAETGWGQFSELRLDEEVLLFPSLGYPIDDGKAWRLEIHGCVFEPENRRLALAVLREILQLKQVKLTASEEAIFRERARRFMVDNERGKRIVVRLGEQTLQLEESGPDGHFYGSVRLSAADVQELQRLASPVRAILPPADARLFQGEASFPQQQGLTVISDVDDTIKVTGVRDRDTMLRRTFLEPFQPVPGMAQVYRAWARKPDTQFCYVSASPWQLFEPLAQFVRSNGFPAGTFHLKKFRLKDQSFLDLFQSPEKYKPAVIDPLLNQYPQRRFILVGDSGERDPEIYGALARRYPRQILRIFIRNVTDEPADAKRYEGAFRDLPPGLWQIFREPAEIREASF